ncbi:putative phytochrome sensor protein [Desulfovibrio sp. X2]|uniref:GAF domain-containing protein n=1 Tax=Desulfovibrio sp. X2 TaxID=941449 RepID=UPI00035876DD|nr:GAF domain-containing protein [Desulfovibrio sp. X2]EPR43898.1 putative phytochrome sensor protein [Desulfovibrio sp. X2]
MERYEAYFRSLYATARVVNSSLDPATVLATIAEKTIEAMSAKGCSIRLLDRSGKRLLPGTAKGLSQEYMRKGPVEVERSAVDKQALAGDIVHIADAPSDPRFQYKEAAKAENIVSVLVVPLQVEGASIGVMRVYSDVPRTFDKAEEEFLCAIASLSALAIENARIHQALKKDYEMLTSFEYRTFED